MFAALSWMCLKQRIGWGVHYLLGLVSVCVGGGPLIRLFVMGCLCCVAERSCGAGVVQMGKVCCVWMFAGFKGTSS